MTPLYEFHSIKSSDSTLKGGFLAWIGLKGLLALVISNMISGSISWQRSPRRKWQLRLEKKMVVKAMNDTGQKMAIKALCLARTPSLIASLLRHAFFLSFLN